MRRLLLAAAPWLIGGALAFGFWLPLVRGGGLIGGDVYNYFLPLKTWYGDGLRRGELRFWHPHIGNGVPVLGESQTGALYPPYMFAYWLLDALPAFNAVLVGHYVAAFAATAWLGRVAGLGFGASLAAGMVFVYGWFPARACLDWAIVAGAWLPVEIGCALLWLRNGRARWGWGLAAALALQLLAGHYQLAWTSLVAVGLAALVEPAPWRRRLGILGYAALGLAFAAPQLWPTWEFKSFSVRNAAEFAAETRYGRLPPGYLAQWWRPWEVFADPKGWLDRCGGDSNIVEAHLYFGMLPFALGAVGLLRPAAWRKGRRWLLLAGLGVLLATGVFSGLLQHLPGFGYFRYPGRYSLIAALFGSLWIGAAAETLAAGPFRRTMAALGAMLFLATMAEYRIVGGIVCSAQVQNPPALAWLAHSELRERLRPEDRVFAPDANTAALFGCAGAPHYIGLEPALYRDLWGPMPDLFKSQPAPTADAVARLGRGGVTKILTEKPLPAEWPVALEWSGVDAFLHRRMGRSPSEPYYLYRFEDGAGRVRLEPPGKDSPQLVVGADWFEAVLPAEHRGGALKLTEWALPGWSAKVDGVAVPLAKGDFLEVAVPAGARMAVFEYTPRAFWRGCGLAVAALAIGLAVEALRRRRWP